jgi:hypothetical protein
MLEKKFTHEQLLLTTPFRNCLRKCFSVSPVENVIEERVEVKQVACSNQAI